MTPEQRIEKLEKQVRALHSALHLFFVGAGPTDTWLDKTFDELDKKYELPRD